MLHAWRRNLQFRVLLTTLVLVTALVAIAGAVLLDQVGRGVLDAKRKASLGEFTSSLTFAQNQLDETAETSPYQVTQLLSQILPQLAGCQTNGFGIVVLATGDDSNEFYTCDVHQGQVPTHLRDVVVGKQVEAYTYQRLIGPLDLPGAVTGTQSLIVGAPLSSSAGGTSYELYLVFPLHTENQTVVLVRNTLAIGGAALVVLLVLLVGLVIRQVVNPVRQAARVASRLAAGRLQERMAIRGEDDLARLGGAFNEMAVGLERQIGQLEELSRVQRRFTADVSHELRTPLTTVRMAAEVLFDSRASFDPAAARSAELLTEQLDRFEALLTDLLEISRYDAGAATLEPVATDLASLVAAEIAHAQALADERGSELQLSGLAGGPVVAEVDPRRLSRIVRNLLSNAIEHGEGRPIEIALVADDSAVAIRVRDHGIGLRPGEAGLVFGRFWRADPSRARRSGGTGLGLSIALEDARLHGGWLQAWGEPGRGASFRLVLPQTAGDTLRQAPLPLDPGAGPRPDTDPPDDDSPADDRSGPSGPPGPARQTPTATSANRGLGPMGSASGPRSGANVGRVLPSTSTWWVP